MTRWNKWNRFLSVLLILSFFMSGCQSGQSQKNSSSTYQKYSDSFFDSFDTIIQFVAYTETEEEFQRYFHKAQERFGELHQLFDIYHTYEGINNLKTINDHAGIKPVKVDQVIIDMILFTKDWTNRTGRDTNIAMGSVLKIWHDYRTAGIDDPANAELPPMDELQEAAKYMDMDKIIVDTANNTVYLADKRMSLDVGSVAKGYATELVAKELMEDGLLSGLLSAGGNIRGINKPLDGIRERWGVGLQDPNQFILGDQEDLLDTVFINNASVVSSGDYQRYYFVDDKLYHHLIDPKTLMPGAYYRAVTIVTEDSGLADFLSTSTYLLPLEQSKALVESVEGVEALWVMLDGTVEATDGMKKIMKSHGATGAKAE